MLQEYAHSFRPLSLLLFTKWHEYSIMQRWQFSGKWVGTQAHWHTPKQTHSSSVSVFKKVLSPLFTSSHMWSLLNIQRLPRQDQWLRVPLKVVLLRSKCQEKLLSWKMCSNSRESGWSGWISFNFSWIKQEIYEYLHCPKPEPWWGVYTNWVVWMFMLLVPYGAIDHWLLIALLITRTFSL